MVIMIVEKETKTERDGIHLPFSDSIMSARLPEQLKPPVFEKYDGLSDAEEHLAVFNAHMLFYGDIATDAIKCRAFPTTLTYSAIRWFFTLPPRSIRSFSGLAAKFLEHHKASRDKRRREEEEEEEEEEEPEHKISRTTSSCSCRGRSGSITFNDDDFTGIHTQQRDDPMVITVRTMNMNVMRVLIDQGSSADILYYDAFIRIHLKDSMMKPFAGALSGEEKGDVKGCIDLNTTFGEGDHAKTINVRYLVVDSAAAYNMIISRPTLNKLGAVVSTPHLTMKYPLPNGKVGVVRGGRKKTDTQR